MSEQIIKNQIRLIKELESIGLFQINEIDRIGNLKLANPSRDHQRAIILVVQKSHLANYWNYVNYFSEKLTLEKEENFHFLVPLIRTLVEIYINLFYLSNQVHCI